MKESQKKTLLLAVAAAIAMLLYPPFQLHYPNGAIVNMGHAWILDPPHSGRASVNVLMLLLQWGCVAAVAALVYYLQGSSDGTSPILAKASGMTTTKLRWIGAGILFVNLWIIGEYNLSGLPVFLLTVGFVVGYEWLLVRPAARIAGEAAKKP